MACIWHRKASILIFLAVMTCVRDRVRESLECDFERRDWKMSEEKTDISTCILFFVVI